VSLNRSSSFFCATKAGVQFSAPAHAQPQDAEDLTQETFLRAYRSLYRYDPSLSFATWLFTIARRAAASHFRAAPQFEELPRMKQAMEGDPAKAA